MITKENPLQTSIIVTYIHNLKRDANGLIHKTETDTEIENKLTVTKGKMWHEQGAWIPIIYIQP